MNQEYLFIGGPADGQRLEVPEGQNEYCIPMYEPINYSARGFDQTELGFQVVRYCKTRLGFWDGGGCVFVAETTDRDNIIKILIQGYNPQKTRQNCASWRGVAGMIPNPKLLPPKVKPHSKQNRGNQIQGEC